MKKRNFILLLSLIFIATACQSQQLMQTKADARKLTDNKEKFINKPLENLLVEIKPEIKAAFGNPDEENEKITSYIRFHFTNQNEYFKRKGNGENPTRILVTLIRPNKKRYPKLDSNAQWTDAQTKIYGDMIVVDISILGKD